MENDAYYHKPATNSGYWSYHSLFNNLIVRMDILPFVKPLNVIITELFVLIKQNWNFKRKYDYKQFKYKIISSLDCSLFATNSVWIFFYCIHSSSCSKDDLFLWQFWIIISLIYLFIYLLNFNFTDLSILYKLKTT